MRRILYLVLLLLCTQALLSQKEAPKDSFELATPYIMSYYDGGLRSNKKFSTHLQTNFFICYSVGVQYDNRFEFGATYVWKDSYSAFLKYNQRLFKYFVVSPSILALQGIRPFRSPSGSLSNLEKPIVLNPGGSVSFDTKYATLKYSYFNLQNGRNGITELNFIDLSYFPATDYLWSLHLIGRYKKSSLHLNLSGYNSLDGPVRTLGGTYSLLLGKKVSLEFGYWGITSGPKMQCDVFCQDVGFRLGVSILL